MLSRQKSLRDQCTAYLADCIQIEIKTVSYILKSSAQRLDFVGSVISYLHVSFLLACRKVFCLGD